MNESDTLYDPLPLLQVTLTMERLLQKSITMKMNTKITKQEKLHNKKNL